MRQTPEEHRIFDEDGGIDDDIHRPILDRTPAELAANNLTRAAANANTWSATIRNTLGRALLWDESQQATLRSQLGSRLGSFATLQQPADTARSASMTGGNTDEAENRDEDVDGGRAAIAGSPSAPEPSRGEVHAAARWLEESMPFIMLLLLTFLYRHLMSILAFFWLTSMLHTANERMRRQTMLRENLSRRALLHVAALLIAETFVIYVIQHPKLVRQLSLQKADETASPPLSTVLWDVLLADLFVRSGLLLLKAACAAVAPGKAARRLRRIFSAIEAVGLFYRQLLPMPLWFHWLAHAAEDANNAATLWSIGISNMYIGFKLVAMVDRVKQATAACKVCVRVRACVCECVRACMSAPFARMQAAPTAKPDEFFVHGPPSS